MIGLRRCGLVLASLAVVAGCGTSADSGQAGPGTVALGPGNQSPLGQCQTADSDVAATPPIESLIERIGQVLRVRGDVLRETALQYQGEPMPDTRVFDFSDVLGVGELTAGRAPFSFHHLDVAFLDLADLLALPPDVDVLIGLDHLEDGTAIAGTFVVLEEGGSARFVGHCKYQRYQRPIDRYLAARGVSLDHATAMAILTDADEFAMLADWFSRPTETPWEQRKPEARLLDIEETPAEYLDALTPVSVSLSMPKSWTSLEGAICTFAPGAGWNECASLAGLGEQGLTDVGLLGWTTAPGSLEFWLLGPSFDVTAPVARLGVVSAAVMFDGGGVLQATVTFFSTRDPGSLLELTEMANGGAVTLEVTPGPRE